MPEAAREHSHGIHTPRPRLEHILGSPFRVSVRQGLQSHVLLLTTFTVAFESEYTATAVHLPSQMLAVFEGA